MVRREVRNFNFNFGTSSLTLSPAKCEEVRIGHSTIVPAISSPPPPPPTTHHPSPTALHCRTRRLLGFAGENRRSTVLDKEFATAFESRPCLLFHAITYTAFSSGHTICVYHGILTRPFHASRFTTIDNLQTKLRCAFSYHHFSSLNATRRLTFLLCIAPKTITIPSPTFLVSDPRAFKLQKLRALRRKVGGVKADSSDSSDKDKMATLPIPASPSSSKRSRSRDSDRSVSASSINTATPSASAPSLLIPSSHTPSIIEPSQDHTPYPAFLRKSTSGRFQDFETEARKRTGLVTDDAASDQPSPWARCSPEEVLNRNRYGNVEPYSANRVKLHVPEGYSDYINASPIVLTSTASKKVTKFIATQGPKDDSYSHIWRMIWHENTSPAVVVMLTQTHEGGREKCFAYYPHSESEEDFYINQHDEFQDGLIHQLKLTSCEDNEETRAQIRELELITEDGIETKKVWHLLFGGWPDFAVPEGADRDALLNLIHLSREKNADNSTNPRIVHCSAGVGRSGTFISLDWLLQELEEGSLDNVGNDEDPVAAVVDMIRRQRMMMVQGETQLAFIYDVMRDRWRERWAKLHPEEAERLAIGAVGEPRFKKPRPSFSQVSMTDTHDHVHDHVRAQLEAELVNAQETFDKGKT
ncbi:hypothetical protein K504DRAFT_507208 [Pleomassaria siparia CBS 279.74]|uniref:Phosphatases II n=1 Tax=Pleomassaria siparia CBS 279.74 TaxID=1314801 RepID=A0A6G1JUA9_9PLEO|nr:hypothetical protein K504DRAFT_507208 [Pleomassaria siparia CBS 279.74]